MKQPVNLNVTHSLLLLISRHLPTGVEYSVSISREGVHITPSVLASTRNRVRTELIDHIAVNHLSELLESIKASLLRIDEDAVPLFRVTPGTWRFTAQGRKNRRWVCIDEYPESLLLLEVII